MNTPRTARTPRTAGAHGARGSRLMGLVALVAFSTTACGDDASQSEASTADTVSAPVTPAVKEPTPETPAPTAPAATPDTATEPASDTATDTATDTAIDDAALAAEALPAPEDLGEGWSQYADEGFPMRAELAAPLATCAAFVDVVFEGNGGTWAHSTLGRGPDIVFASVTVFPTDAEAAAMVAATADPDFDQCWSDFNEVAVVAMPFGIDSSTYEVVTPPDVELGGDSSSLQALEGTIQVGSSTIPDSCVCAFVQQGRAVLAFHSAAPIFSAAQRSGAIAAAVARIAGVLGD
jgi:hypothetical protein